MDNIKICKRTRAGKFKEVEQSQKQKSSFNIGMGEATGSSYDNTNRKFQIIYIAHTAHKF